MIYRISIAHCQQKTCMYTHFFHTFRKLGEDQGAAKALDSADGIE